MIKEQKGIAIIEFALIAPILCYLLFGLLQYGWLLMKYLALTNAAAVGAIYLATQGPTSSAPSVNTATIVCNSLGGTVTSGICRLSGISVTIYMNVFGTTCDDAAGSCKTLFSQVDNPTHCKPVSPSTLSATLLATVTVSYTFTSAALLPGVEFVMPTTISETSAMPLPATC